MAIIKKNWISILKRSVIVCASVVAFVMIACDTGVSLKQDAAVTKVTVTPTTAAIALDGARTQQFTAVVEGTGDFTKTVTWEVLGNKNPETAISNTGMLTVAADESAGTILTVKATSTEASVSGIATVTLTLPSTAQNQVTGVIVTPATANVVKGESQQFTATVSGNGVFAQTVTWEIEGSAHAETAISDTGMLTVSAEESAGTVITVTAASTGDTSIKGAATATVYNNNDEIPQPTGVIISPESATVEKGGFYIFSATVEGNEGVAQDVLWSIEDAGKHADTTIDAAGKLTVSADEILTTLTVKAAVTANANISAASAVTLTSIPTGVVINPESATVEKGGTQQFSAEVQGPVGVAQAVLWSIEDAGKHADTTIDQTGKLTVSVNEALTTLTVKAAATANTNISAASAVTLTSIPTGVIISPKSVTMEKGEDQERQFRAEVQGPAGVSQDVVSWSIVETNRHDDTWINYRGKLMVSAEETLDTLTVKAAVTGNSALYDEATVTLTIPQPRVIISPKSTGVENGDSQQFSASVTGGLSQSVTWSIVETGKHPDTTIDQTGKLTVSVNETLTTLTVKATADANAALPGEAIVTPSSTPLIVPDNFRGLWDSNYDEYVITGDTLVYGSGTAGGFGMGGFTGTVIHTQTLPGTPSRVFVIQYVVAPDFAEVGNYTAVYCHPAPAPSGALDFGNAYDMYAEQYGDWDLFPPVNESDRETAITLFTTGDYMDRYFVGGDFHSGWFEPYIRRE